MPDTDRGMHIPDGRAAEDARVSATDACGSVTVGAAANVTDTRGEDNAAGDARVSATDTCGNVGAAACVQDACGTDGTPAFAHDDPQAEEAAAPVPTVRVRPFTDADIDAAMEIEKRCFADPWSRDMLTGDLAQAAARYVALEVDGRLKGYAGVWLIFEESHVTNVAVCPDVQGRGYGRLLMRTLMEIAAEHGSSWMMLEVRRSNERAQGLYKSLGFTALGYRKRYYENNGEDALIMVKEEL